EKRQPGEGQAEPEGARERRRAGEPGGLDRREKPRSRRGKGELSPLDLHWCHRRGLPGASAFHASRGVPRPREPEAHKPVAAFASNWPTKGSTCDPNRKGANRKGGMWCRSWSYPWLLWEPLLRWSWQGVLGRAARRDRGGFPPQWPPPMRHPLRKGTSARRRGRSPER